MRKIVVTGGFGFIGSHLVEKLVNRYPEDQVWVLDIMNYATHTSYLDSVKDRIKPILGDIRSFSACLFALEDTDILIHVAAESHVDNSFSKSMLFTNTNVLGTHNLIEAARIRKVSQIIHISTDEVYGENTEEFEEYNETHRLNPTNPYSASKAAAEMIINGYVKSFDLPIKIVRPNNTFGERQYPEKLIPKCCVSLLNKKKIPIHGSGTQKRTFLHVKDLCNAILLVLEKGVNQETYNIGTEDEYQNIEIASLISVIMGQNPLTSIEFVEDRAYNDKRYNINCDKIKSLGWLPEKTVAGELPAIVNWYANNERIINELQNT